MKPFLFDTAVFIYAVGTEHPYRLPCRAIVERQRNGELAGEASVELVQELLYVVRRRRPEREAGIELAKSVVGVVSRLHDFEAHDLGLALTLLGRHPELSERDAVHAATALNRGLEAILSPDRDLDSVPGLARIDPMDEAAVSTLSA